MHAHNKLTLPGFVCAHTHLYSVLARGMPAPAEPPRNFVEILERIWWRLDRALDAEAVELSALVGAIEAAHAGCTTLVDHHASPGRGGGAVDGSLDLVAGAIAQVGLRGIVCYEVTDRNGADQARAGVRENDRFLARVRREPPRLIRAMGPLPAVGDLSAGQILDAIGHDKKIVNGRLHFVLPKAIGTCEVVDDVTTEEIERALAALGLAR